MKGSAPVLFPRKCRPKFSSRLSPVTSVELLSLLSLLYLINGDVTLSVEADNFEILRNGGDGISVAHPYL